MASINRYARVRQAQLTFNRHRYIRFCKHRTTYIIILFCLIVNLHIFIFFQINYDQCYARRGSYRIFFVIFHAICPSCIMIVINIATVTNIRCIRRSIHPAVSRQEYHFIILVIVHSISNFIFLTFEYSI